SSASARRCSTGSDFLISERNVMSLSGFLSIFTVATAAIGIGVSRSMPPNSSTPTSRRLEGPSWTMCFCQLRCRYAERFGDICFTYLFWLRETPERGPPVRSFQDYRIQKDFVVGFAGPRPREVNHGFPFSAACSRPRGSSPLRAWLHAGCGRLGLGSPGCLSSSPSRAHHLLSGIREPLRQLSPCLRGALRASLGSAASRRA